MSRYVFVFVAAACLMAYSGAMPQAAALAGDARVQRACAGMGLNPSEAPFAYCVMSLGETAASLTTALRINQERHECGRLGYHPGTSIFANCVLDREETVSATRAASAESPAQETAATEAFRSYRRGDQMTSVRHACAELGLAPGSDSFASCVGNLSMTIDDSQMVGSD